MSDPHLEMCCANSVHEYQKTGRTTLCISVCECLEKEICVGECLYSYRNTAVRLCIERQLMIKSTRQHASIWHRMDRWSNTRGEQSLLSSWVCKREYSPAHKSTRGKWILWLYELEMIPTEDIPNFPGTI